MATTPEGRSRATSLSVLRRQVRQLVESSGVRGTPMCDAWMRGHDLDFTKVLARHRLIGLTWPEDLGGRGGTNVERMVVTEELLRVGAPVAAHWIADRQIGPAILRHGSSALQRALLPRIANGEVTFCLGMSETESGSDLAALRTKAAQDGADFRITGRKIWTSHAHRSTHAYVLARTGGGDGKHEGLTEFVVDLSSPGVEVRPIFDLSGEHHFNETIFDDVVVSADKVIGEVGNGWRQVTEQLAFERGGMERVLSTYPLLAFLLRGGVDGSLARGTGGDVEALGVLVARLHTLRAMALGVAAAMDSAEPLVHRAAMLKYLGTNFESDVVEQARHTMTISPDPRAGGDEGVLAGGILASPGATLRGGTNEVLLTILGRAELSGNASRRVPDSHDLRDIMDEVLARQGRAEIGAPLDDTWNTAVELGWTGIGVPEGAGGSGGNLHDLAVVATALARHGRSAPVVDTALAGCLLADAGRKVDTSRPMALALGNDVTLDRRGGELVLNGTQPRVPWAQYAGSVILAAQGPEGEVLVELPLNAHGVSVTSGTNMAGEARDRVGLANVRLPTDALVGDDAVAATTRARLAVLQSAAIVGALEAATDLARDHVTTREQFGKPLAAFQAVAHTIARMATEVANAQVAVAQGLAEVDAMGQGWRAVVARIITSRAATAVAKGAHQMLGAMGITREHDLHLATLRLWAWRDEVVGERALAHRLGQTVLAAGEDATWDWCVLEADAISGDDRSAWRSR